MTGERMQMADEESQRRLAAAVADHRAGRLPAAIAGYNQILGTDPENLDALNNLGVALRATGRRAAAVACYDRALAIRPDNPQCLSNRGNALRELDRFDEAAASLRRAVNLAPENAAHVFNLGLVMRDINALDEALACFDRALALDPGYAEAHLDRALVLLRRGEFAEGLDEYEWRWKLSRVPERPFDKPLWQGEGLGQGEDLAGRTVLVHQEQGYGDAIQFIRYAPMIEARGGKVIVECRPRLMPLLEGARGVSAVTQLGAPLPEHDFRTPILSLPRLFGTRLETIPAAARYLRPPADAGPAQSLIDGLRAERRLKVGFAWAGSPNYQDDPRRSCDVAHFVGLLGVPGARFFSLQKDAAAAALSQATGGGLVTEAERDTRHFADSAAVTAAMDLIITVDTVTGHLAGALGKPVWILLPYHADWRWLMGRFDTPWYPSARLFRQTRPGGWQGVFADVAEALKGALKGSAPGGA